MFESAGVQALKQTMNLSLSFTRTDVHSSSRPFELLGQQTLELLLALSPIALCILLAGFASHILLGGWSVSFNSVLPNASRLNILKGLGNIFSSHSLVEVIKAIAKALLVGGIAYYVFLDIFSVLMNLSRQSVAAGISEVSSLLHLIFFKIAAGLIIIALIDAPYQLWRYKQKHKMSKHELKQEFRQADGNPEVRAKIRKQQRAISSQRMWSQISEADVVLLNPTHYAVALKYRENEMRAPMVVAKGLDEVALKIRSVAQNHEVMLLESPKLARALHAHTEIGEEIPQALYLAVAEILAFVFELKAYKYSEKKYPTQPDEKNVPDDLDPLNPVKSSNSTP
jgi:flagellar biosynthetic protein FlhB